MANILLKSNILTFHYSIIPFLRQAYNPQKMFYIFNVILISSLFISGCVSTREAKKKEILGLDTQHFKDTVVITDVSSGTVAEFSTLNGYRPKKYVGVGWLDSFLKGYLNKNTGKRYYQVYQFISYQGRGWRSYHRVDYQTPEGKASAPLTSYHREIINRASSRGCTYEEHVVFDIEEALLRKIAKLTSRRQEKFTAQGRTTVFLYQLYSKEGHKRTYWLLPAEVAGLLERMDEYVTEE